MTEANDTPHDRLKKSLDIWLAYRQAELHKVAAAVLGGQAPDSVTYDIRNAVEDVLKRYGLWEEEYPGWKKALDRYEERTQ